MELIINIPEDRYKDVIEAQKHHLLDSYAQAVANGTPLEQITDEIRQIVDEETEHDETWARGLHYSLCVIDKYKGDKE